MRFPAGVAVPQRRPRRPGIDGLPSARPMQSGAGVLLRAGCSTAPPSRDALSSRSQQRTGCFTGRRYAARGSSHEDAQGLRSIAAPNSRLVPPGPAPRRSASSTVPPWSDIVTMLPARVGLPTPGPSAAHDVDLADRPVLAVSPPRLLHGSDKPPDPPVRRSCDDPTRLRSPRAGKADLGPVGPPVVPDAVDVQTRPDSA